MTTVDPSSPLPAPTVPLSDMPPPLPTALLSEPRVVPAGAAIQWMTTGWEMFKAAPGPWVGITLVALIVTAVVSVVPIIGMLNVVLSPILTAGLIAACEAQRTGSTPRVEHLWAGFRKSPANLALVGVFYLVGGLIIAVVVGGGGFAAMLPFIVAASASGDQFTVTPTMIAIVALFVLLAVALFIPLGLAMAWAPPLVYLHDVGPFDALKRSLFACLRNWQALLVFMVVAMVLGCIAMIPLGLGLLVYGPVMVIAIWAGYREVFVA